MHTNPNTQRTLNSAQKNLKIERFADLETATLEAGKYINDILTQYIDRPVLFLVAGGSSIKVLEHINPEYLGQDLTVTTTDDRFSTELDINNFSILQTTSFYNNLIQNDCFCISTEPFEHESIEDYALRFEKNLKEWKRDFPNGIVVGLYGMGSDGHTGGMIPGFLLKEKFTTQFNTADKWVGIFDALTEGKGDQYQFPQRISTSLTFMREVVDHAIFYITGKEKKEAFDAAIRALDATTTNFDTCPAKILNFMKNTVVFTDIA